MLCRKKNRFCVNWIVRKMWEWIQVFIYGSDRTRKQQILRPEIDLKLSAFSTSYVTNASSNFSKVEIVVQFPFSPCYVFKNGGGKQRHEKNWCNFFTQLEFTGTKLVFLNHSRVYLTTRNGATVWSLLCTTEGYWREDLVCGIGRRSLLVHGESSWRGSRLLLHVTSKENSSPTSLFTLLAEQRRCGCLFQTLWVDDPNPLV